MPFIIHYSYVGNNELEKPIVLKLLYCIICIFSLGLLDFSPTINKCLIHYSSPVG